MPSSLITVISDGLVVSSLVTVLIHAAANLASFLQGQHPQSLGSHALHTGR
jgi:hypothetical protein